MGTNYYACKDVCGCCGKPDEQWHICKSFRTFRYYYDWNGPLGKPIAEVKQWWPILRDNSIIIRDEYGTWIDKEEFIADCMKHGRRTLEDEEMYRGHKKDAEGYILYNGDFF